MDRFRTSAKSRRAVVNLALAFEIKATLFAIKPYAKVSAEDGMVNVGG